MCIRFGASHLAALSPAGGHRSANGPFLFLPAVNQPKRGRGPPPLPAPSGGVPRPTLGPPRFARPPLCVGFGESGRGLWPPLFIGYRQPRANGARAGRPAHVQPQSSRTCVALLLVARRLRPPVASRVARRSALFTWQACASRGSGPAPKTAQARLVPAHPVASPPLRRAFGAPRFVAATVCRVARCAPLRRFRGKPCA